MTGITNVSGLCGLIVFCLAFTSTAQPQNPEASPETQRAFQAWAGSLVPWPPADLQGQGYQELMKMPDADLVFLPGLNHHSDPVRRLSTEALARLKTDRSFEILVNSLRDHDMFVRERAIRTLALFQEKRCVAPIAHVLESDPEAQLRKDAAYEMRRYDSEISKAALMTALGDPSMRVASMAACSLIALGVEEAIDPAYHLVLKADTPNAVEGGALDALKNCRKKMAVNHLIRLMEILPDKFGERGKQFVESIDVHLLPYAKITAATLGPVPDTVEQWCAWWSDANDLFDDDMQLIDDDRRQETYSDAEFATDVALLRLSASVDSRSYRQGDPIRLDIAFENTTDRPFRVVLPDPPSGWYPTMAWGIKLKRTRNQPLSVIDITPSPYYIGSYCGPPEFSTLHPKDTFRDSICLQHWLSWEKYKWPLPEGTYELILSFDSSQFPGITPDAPELTGLWAAAPVTFEVKGRPRQDRNEVLKLIAEKAGKKWLMTDLTSRRADRREAAWRALSQYGDTRILYVLNIRFGQSVVSRNLRSFFHAPLRELTP